MANSNLDKWVKKYGNWTPPVGRKKPDGEVYGESMHTAEDEATRSWVEKYGNWKPATSKKAEVGTQQKTITQRTGENTHIEGAGGGRRTPLPTYTPGALVYQQQGRKTKSVGTQDRATEQQGDNTAQQSTADRLLGEFLGKLADTRAAHPHATWTQEEIENAYKQYVQDYYAALDVDAETKRREETERVFMDAKANYEAGIFGRHEPVYPEEERGDFRTVSKPNKNARATTLEDVGRIRDEAVNLENDIEIARSVQYDRAGSRALAALREKGEDGAAALDALVKGPDLTGLKMAERAERRRTWKETTAQAARSTLRELGYSDEEIDELVEYRQREQDREQYESDSASLTDLAKKGFWGRAAATGVRMASGIPMGVAGAVDLATQRASGKPINWYSPGIAAQRTESDIVNAVAGELAEKYDWEVAGQNVAAFLYQTGISMSDSAIIAGLTAMGVPAWLGTAALGTSAGTQAAIDAHERGVSDSKAFTTGLMAGIAETVFEKVSLEMLLKPGAVDGATVGKRFLQILRNLGVQSFTEGSEELFTDLANAMSDRWINGGQREFNENVRRYVLSGMSKEDARKAASRDFAVQLGSSFVGGAISGGIMSGGAQLLQTGGANRQAKAVYGAPLNSALRNGDPEGSFVPENKSVSDPLKTANEGGFSDALTDVLFGDGAKENAARSEAAESPIHVGKATTIYHPYQGEVPVQTATTGKTVEVPSDALARAQANIESARQSATSGERGFKTALMKLYDKAFRHRSVAVNGMTFDGQPYMVEIGKNVPGKVVSDKNTSAEKMAVLDILDDVVCNAAYVGSGEYTPKQEGNPKNVTRYDYFETPVQIGKTPYIVSFDVEVFPYANNYRTHRINEIELSPASGTVPGPAPGAHEGGTTLLSDPTIPQPSNVVKPGQKNNTGTLTAKAAEDLAAIEQDHRRQGADEDALQNLRTAFRAAYLYGTTGKLEASDRADIRAMGLSEAEIDLAFAHGKAAVNPDAGNKTPHLPAAQAPSPRGGGLAENNTQQKQNMKEEQNHGEKQDIRVRDGGKRNGGESADRQGEGVEREAGVRQGQSTRRGGAEAQSRADGEAGASQSSTRALIGEAGSESGGSVYTVGDHYSENTKKAAKMARQRGVDAVFFTGGELTLASGAAARGYIDLKNGKVWVRADDPQYSAEQIMRHELGHDAVAKGEIDPGEVYDRLAKQYGEENMGQIMALYSELYEGAGLSADEVWEEILCDSLADMNAFSNLSAVTELVEEFLRSAKEEAQQNAKENAGAGNKKAADTGGKASLRMEFGAEIDAWNGRSERTFRIGTTSSALRSIGVQNREIIWRGKKIADIMQKHPAMTREIIKQVPQILEQPVAVLESKQSGSRLVLFGTVQDAQGDPVTAILELQPTTRGGELMDMNVIASAYGKSSNAAQFIRSSGLVYLDENRKRTEKWMQGLGLQLPSDTTIFGSIGRITYHDGKVKIESVPYEQYMQEGGSYTQFGQEKTADMDGKTSRVADGLEQLQEENRELREQVNRFQKELRSAERRIQNARESRDQWRDRATFHTERVCREIIKAYHGTVSEEEIHDGIKKLTYYAARKDGITYEALRHLAEPVAAQVVKSASAVANGEEAQAWSDMKKHLRDSRIKVSREVVRDIDNWGDFWRRNGRRLNLVTGKDGISVDTAYDELRERFGEAYFPERITHPADQLRRIAEVYDNMQPVFENPYSLNIAMATEHCANDLVDMVMKEVSRGYMATYTGQLEEKLYQSRKYTEKLLEKERAHSDEQIRALKKHWQEQRAKEIEGRQDSELRQRLLNVAKRLKNKKLPTVSRNLLNQYTQQILTEAQREIFDKLDTESRSMRSSTREGLEWLRDQYKYLEKSDDNFIPDAATVERIERLSKLQIDSLTHQDVVELTYVLLNIENEIRNAKHLIDSAEKRDLREAGVAIMRDIKNSPGSKASGIGNVLDKFIVTETLSPLRQVRRMVGYVENDPLLIATRELADGQRKSFDYKMRAQARFQKFVDDKAFMDRIAGKHAELMTIRGIGDDGPTEVQITPAMKISLYLHSKNNQSLRHIAGGGIRVPDAAEYRKGNMEEAYDRGTVVTLEAGEVKKIAANLTAEERRFADAVFDYFNTMSKEEVNAVSEKLLGYPVAEVENYFPINTDESFTKKDFESIKYNGSIEGMGFLKERINSASPIYLRDVTDVLLRSIDQHSRYVGLGVAVRNFNKLWGVTAKNHLDKNMQLASSSVQSNVMKQWGKTGYGYIEKMMSDLQTGGKEQDSWGELFNEVRSSYAGAVLTLNVSVAMKQAASYPTAAAVVGWKPLIVAFKNVGKVDLDLIAAYTPLQWYRSQGFSTQELGDMAKRGIKWPAALNWVQGADLLTTRKLWKAAEIYVRENNPDLRRGTPAEIRAGESPFYKAVAEVYNRIIEETQPNYTTMQRPQLLRSENAVIQNLQMFKTQPFQNFNILYDAVGELQARERAYQVEQTEENKVAVREAWKNVGRAVSSQIVQLFVFAGMTFLWNAFRGKMDKYKDKEGEESVLSTMGGIGLDMVSGLLSELPFGSDAWEFGFNLVSGGKYYGVSDVTTSAINDVANQISSAYKTVSGLLTGDIKDANTVRLRLDGAADAVSKLFGVPYENVANLGKAVFRIGAKALEGDYMGEYSYLQLTTDPTGSYKGDYYDLLYEAYKKDPAAHREIRRRMIESGYFDEKKIKSAMETRMKKEQGVNSVDDLARRYTAP